MEELKLLIGMVSDLPTMAIWVLLFFFIYKVTIIGSVFGLIKLFIMKLHSYLTTPKHELKHIDITGEIGGLIIKDCADSLLAQIRRLVGVSNRYGSAYIHASDINWLRKAIDEKLEREKEKENKKGEDE